MNWKYFMIILIFICGACEKEEYFGPTYTNQISGDIDNYESRLLVGCEGNFQYSNASISVIDLDEKVVSNNVYRNSNGRPIGDVLQSFTVKGDTLLVVLNNSGTIKLLDIHTLKEIESFSGFVSPRYVKFLDDENILITDIYAGRLIRYNFLSKTITGSIITSSWQEQILVEDGFAFVANLTMNRLDVIDLSSFILQESIPLTFKPSYLKTINNNRFVVAGENLDTVGIFQISVFNSEGTELSYSRLSASVAGFDCESSDCYYSDSRFVHKFNPNSGLTAKLFEHQNLITYALHYNSAAGLIVTCDAKDYISNGEIQVFNTNGDLLKNYSVGIIPQTIHFAL
jgi:hypothetical protein